MPMVRNRRLVRPALVLAGLAALAGCTSHSAPPKAPPAPTAPAIRAAKPPVNPVQTFLQRFGKGSLAAVKQMAGPDGLTAVLVAPPGTKVVTPTTPSALLWVLPGGKYAMTGTLLAQDGTNLTLQYSERLGVNPPMSISTPTAPPVSAAAPATSANVLSITVPKESLPGKGNDHRTRNP